MNSIKSLLVVTVLATVAYGVYVSLNQPAPGPPPEGAPVDWNVAPLAAAPVHMGLPAAATDAAPQWPTGPAPVAPGLPPVEQAAPAPLASTTSPADYAAPQAAAASATPAPANAGESATAYSAAPVPEYRPENSPPMYEPATAPLATALPAPTDYSQAAASASPASVSPTAAAPGTEGTSSFDFVGLVNQVQTLLDQGHVTTAQMTLSESFHHFEDPGLSADQRLSLYTLLDQLTGTIIYSTEHLLEPAYVVQAGDTLDRVATAYGVPWQLLAKINALDTSQPLQVGQKLKVVRGPFSAFVELGQQRLTLWLNGRYAGRFGVSLGQDAPAADGEFAILDKVENPAYFGPAGSVAANDPQNPLGRHWLDLGNRIGLHASRSDATADPRGYFRLAPSDAEDVYDILTVGSRVYIQR